MVDAGPPGHDGLTGLGRLPAAGTATLPGSRCRCRTPAYTGSLAEGCPSLAKGSWL